MILETLNFPITFLRVGMDIFWNHTVTISYISSYPVDVAMTLGTEVGVKCQLR